MAAKDRLLAKLETASQRVQAAEEKAAREREAMYALVREAWDSGAKLSELARAIGVTRQAAQKIADRVGIDRSKGPGGEPNATSR
jgi:hypothetical protein